MQLAFDTPEFEGVRPVRHRRRSPRSARPESIDPLEVLFEQRLAAQCEGRTVETYRWLRRDVLRIASGLAGHDVTITDLFRDSELMGRALVTDEGRHGRRVSKSTIAHRRTLVRSLARLLHAELHQEIDADPHHVIVTALRAVATRRGSGYRIDTGIPRTRGGPTPSASEMNAILDALSAGRGWDALRDRAFFLLLGRTAARVTSLRTLDGGDCTVLRDGRVRLLLHQKNGQQRHEVELDSESAETLRLYVAAFNHAVRQAGSRERIVLGEHGPIWRSLTAVMWPDSSVRNTLRRACARAGVQRYTPHAFRRFWATGAAAGLPRREAALAGGWRGTERFDQHYVTPSRATVRRKLGRLISRAQPRAPVTVTERTDAPAVPV